MSREAETNHNSIIEKFDDPKYYQNREISWLDFNYRVICEALDDRNPLLEQLSFIAIGSSNLDEFMQVRVAGLQDQDRLNVNEPDSKKQWSPAKQLSEIAQKNQKIVKFQYDVFHQKISEIAELGYPLKEIVDLDGEAKKQLEDIFEEKIQPAITPFGIDAYRPFPHLHDGNIQIFVELEKDGNPFVAIVPITPLIERYHLVKLQNGQTAIVFTEDIVSYFAPKIFIGYDIRHQFYFRVTRNADLELQEEGAEDLLIVIEDYLEQRQNGRAVRLEVDTRGSNESLVSSVAFLIETLELTEQDVYAVNGPLDLTFLHQVKDDLAKEYPDLTYPEFSPFYPPVLRGKSIFEAADEKDIYLHHPYDSFRPIVEMIQEASKNPNTISIKMTLYRVSSDSKLVQSLMEASKNGIQVTVLMELKARFDEKNNVIWAKELEDAGVHILYGVKELKTHSKAALVVLKDGDDFKRYVHLGTGNYHEKTANLYTDMGIITAHPALTEDVANFFNYLSGYSERPDYHHLHVSPFEIRDTFVAKIDREIEYHQKFGNGHIIAKMNSLTDKVCIQRLYRASQAGVKIELIIRGICCLIPGIPGLSDNIHVRSIVGRFLEHSRIYYFHNNGSGRLYLSSADLMTRNMVHRVETAFPVLDDQWHHTILDTLNLFLKDNTKAWELQADETYVKQQPEADEEEVGAQLTLTQKSLAQQSKQKNKPHKNWLERLREKLIGNE